jgi:hypothetical protein
MTDESPIQGLSVLAARKASLLEEAAAIDRDMADLARLASKYNLTVSAPGGQPATPSAQPAPPAALPPGPATQTPQISAFDGTLLSLVRCYRADSRSGYSKLTYNARLNYDAQIDRLVDEVGASKPLAELDAAKIQQFHDDWTKGQRKLAMGHALVGKLRLLFGFGMLHLNDPECTRLSTILHKLRFSTGRKPRQRLTAEHVVRIRAEAHRMRRPSIALAQALQFELGLLQKDVIGEWVPIAEKGTSEITWNGQKWLRGLRWSEIDDDLILRRSSSNEAIDLKQLPMISVEIMALIERHKLDGPPRVGPMIISERDHRPWTGGEFRRLWRQIATAAGVPKEIKNMDTRPTASSGPQEVSAGGPAQTKTGA